MSDIIVAEVFVVASLILDLLNLDYYLTHIKLLSEGEPCKFLKSDHEKGLSKCTHPRNKRLFKNGICKVKCPKKLGKNIEISTIDAMKKNNLLLIFKLTIEIFVSIYLIAF